MRRGLIHHCCLEASRLAFANRPPFPSFPTLGMPVALGNKCTCWSRRFSTAWNSMVRYEVSNDYHATPFWSVTVPLH